MRRFLAVWMGLAGTVVGAGPGWAGQAEGSGLPAGPEGPGPFGAFYTRLRYSEAWERPWRVGDVADVLVRFEDGGHRFVFWRGTSYIPCWVTQNGIWYTNEFCETDRGGTEGCAEPISDKHTRYSHVRIIESHPARVVVHWRYALTDVHYRLAYVDATTGWGDWVDEYYTIYPDATAVRKIVLWTSRPDVWHEYQEAIVIHPAGSGPEDSLETAAVTIANLQGDTGDYVWEEAGTPKLTREVPDACIEVINTKAMRKPFVVMDPADTDIIPFGGHAPGSRFHCWDHWPVSQDKSWIRVATRSDRPSHTSLSWITKPRESRPASWSSYDPEEPSAVRMMLNGLSERPARDIVRLAKSWLAPPRLKVVGEGYVGGEYDRAERVYRVTRDRLDQPSPLELTLEASTASPLFNPAIVVSGWGEDGAAVLVDGEPVAREGIRIGRERKLDGVDLVLWFRLETDRPVRVVVRPRVDR